MVRRVLASILLLGLLSSLLACAGEAQAVGKYPLHILIIRHAEKSDDDADIHLTSRGAARAAALPSLFAIAPSYPTKPAPLPTPDYLFAARESKKSNRSVETLQPLAKALGTIPINEKHKNDFFQGLIDEIFGDPKYAGKTVLICWHHGNMPGLGNAVLEHAKNKDAVKPLVPIHVKDSVYDRVWQITFDEQGKAAFANQPQRLLFKDKAE